MTGAKDEPPDSAGPRDMKSAPTAPQAVPSDLTGPPDKPGIELLDGAFAIYRFAPGDALPDVSALPEPWAVVGTEDGVTLVCHAGSLPLAPATDSQCKAAEASTGWSAFRVEGPLDFSLTGVLAGISGVLTEAGISIFAISCWETDYVLVRDERREDARAALTDRGYPVR